MASVSLTKGRYEKKFHAMGSPEKYERRFDACARHLGYRPDPYAQDGEGYVLASLYFDTPDFACLQSNADGDYFHVKYRIRMYEGGDKLYYEVKYKRGELIFKRRRGLPMHDIEIELARREFRTLIFESQADELISSAVLGGIDLLRPSCLVRYQRLPFVGTPDERICLDNHLAFGPPLLDTRHWFGPSIAQVNEELNIIELKSNPKAVTRSLLAMGKVAGNAISRFSKYCEAATWVHGDPAQYGPNPYIKLPAFTKFQNSIPQSIADAAIPDLRRR